VNDVTNARGSEANGAEPACPRCRAPLAFSKRVAQNRERPYLRVGSPAPPRKTFTVWHCVACGIDWPYYE